MGEADVEGEEEEEEEEEDDEEEELVAHAPLPHWPAAVRRPNEARAFPR